MKYTIDLIDDIRENIANNGSYSMVAGLLKEDEANEDQLIFAGQANICASDIDKSAKKIVLKVDPKRDAIDVQNVLPALYIVDMDVMMFELVVDVNTQYRDMEVVGFGKNDESKEYMVFIKI